MLITLLLVIASGGCTSLRSRYALDDPVYAQKYAEGASKKNIAGKIKQAIDARHTKYLIGWLAGGGTQVVPDEGDRFSSIDLSRAVYQTDWFTTRLGLSGYSGDDTLSLGVDVGARLQTPTRLAPFVGVGGYGGVSLEDAVPLIIESAFDSTFDSDDSFESVSTNDSSNTVGGLALFYPEVGAHFWVDGKIRLSTFGRYLITSQGRDTDGWYVGAQIALFTR